MKPLTRYEHDCAYVHGDYFSRMVEDENGDWYAKDEADAVIRELEADNVGLRSITLQQADRIAELEAEIEAARADAERWRAACDEGRVGLNSDGEVVILHHKGDADAAIDAARSKP